MLMAQGGVDQGDHMVELLPLLQPLDRIEHGQIGRELAESWGLPAELIEAVACHHRPMRSEKDVQIASLVHVSDAVARKLGVGSGGDSTVPEPASSAT